MQIARNIVMNRKNIENAYKLLESCTLCPRNCKVNRLKGKKGFCGMDKDLMISSYGPHFGEEDVLVGRHGSGTIFLTGCNLGCIFCQNYDISHLKHGHNVNMQGFVDIMLNLQKMSCHNINFVTPTHFTPQIMEAIYIAREKGLTIPVVYNCGGYEALQTLELLEGFVEIYMPDVKYSDSQSAKELSNAPDYPEVIKKALIEMHRQVGDLVVDDGGIAEKGLLVRHLVLPNGLAGTERTVSFIAEDISKGTYINIMDQYRPMYKATAIKKIDRYIYENELQQALSLAKDKGLHRGFLSSI